VDHGDRATAIVDIEQDPIVPDPDTPTVARRELGAPVRSWIVGERT